MSGEKMDLIKFDNPKNIAEFLKEPTIRMAEILTGVLVSDVDDFKLAAGHLVQASIKSKFFQQLGKELKVLQEKGRVKEDYLSEQTNLESLYDLLSFIDETPPNEQRFMAMKTLFLKSINANSLESDRILAHHFMKICREIGSDELLVLKAAYDICNGMVSKQVAPSPSNIEMRGSSARNWLNIIAGQIGHKIMGLVEIREAKLVDLKLISPRIHPDLSGILVTDHFRLTALGYHLCEFLYKTEA